jgi:uncharacterized cupredoxin-like copper-binding protein
MNTRHTTRYLLTLMTLGLSLTAWAGAGPTGHEHSHAHGHADGSDESVIGQPGDAAKVGRTITIDMSDNMRFSPSGLQVRQGETVRLVIRNKGKVRHELSLGTQTDLLVHLEAMKKYPDMEHDEPNSVSREPGKQGEIIWQFTRAGRVHFACLIPGHYEAGMKGTVQVGGK